ncbi:MAG: MobP2 family relaxase, partial [Paraclostridium sp.]
LEKHDLYNPVTHELDEVKIKNAVRKSIGFVLDKDNLSDSAIWNGAIHYNTDNIHIHVAICEPEPTRQRGKRTQKTLDIMKSKFINELLNTKDLYKEINKNIREDIVDTKKDFSCSNDKEMKKLLKKAIKSLPKDKRHWHYGYNTMSESNKHIDEITKYYINKYKKNEFETLCKNLDKQEELIKETYGVGEREKYKDYKQNKIDELYKRMGNTIIKEMKENIEFKSNKNMKNLLPNLNLKISKADIKKIEKSLSNDIDSYKNISLYEKLQQQIEHEL